MINSFMRAARVFEGHLRAFALVCIIGAIALAPAVLIAPIWNVPNGWPGMMDSDAEFGTTVWTELSVRL